MPCGVLLYSNTLCGVLFYDNTLCGVLFHNIMLCDVLFHSNTPCGSPNTVHDLSAGCYVCQYGRVMEQIILCHVTLHTGVCVKRHHQQD